MSRSRISLRHPAVLLVTLLLGCGDGAGPGSDSDPLRFVEIAVGMGFTCGLTEEGAAYCWGYAYGRQPGNDDMCPGGPCDSRPRRMAASQALTDLTANDRHACALGDSGLPYCWGMILIDADFLHPLGDTPVPLPNGVSLRSISAGLSHICGVTADHQAYCWGDYEGGRRGDPTISFDTSYATFVPNLVTGGLMYQEVAAGWFGTCGLTLEGEVYCWGSNGLGALGNPSAAVQEDCGLSLRPCAVAPGPVAGGHRFTTISGGGGHVCGRTAIGELYCWGYNSAGQLGSTAASAEACPDAAAERCSSSPVQVFSSRNPPFTTVRAGGTSTCALDDAGNAFCWGENSYGQVGNGGGPAPFPSPVVSDLHFLDIAVSEDHACGITLEGLAYCWGDNAGGQLGTGDRRDSNEPVAVVGPLDPS